ncbi:MAG: cell envelope integrity protein CreD [Treponema sp.]|jgi:inner membrane protein|nr:cell envelope integrity protein CreD [Treponema sp.]
MDRFRNFTGTRGFKVFLLTLLILLFLIPVAMIRDIIYERSLRASGAENEIMRSWGEEFAVQGPLLRIPCRGIETVKIRNDRMEEKTETREIEFSVWIVPEELKADIQLGTEIKRRGIFSVPLFAGKVHLTGAFDPGKIAAETAAKLAAYPAENRQAFPESAELVIPLASQRGIRGIERALWNGGGLNFLSGNRGFLSGKGSGGVYSAAPLRENSAAPRGGSSPGEQKNTFDIAMAIQGGNSLQMIPLGEDSAFTLKADWPSPSFQGNYLPAAHVIDEKGFEARWEISHLSRNIPLAWTSGPELDSDLFGVNFFKVLDHYDVNIRAIKYALLFIIIPFLGFFLFELLLRRNIHPVQYLLAGIGNVVFYLLLLSFSEHLPFPPAYWISALAVTLMMSLYSRSLLGAWNKSWLMGLIMALCYTFLYFTLQSEDWALLIGSLGAFGITGVVMFLTRNLDWYKRRPPAAENSGESPVPGAAPAEDMGTV